jgi:DNA helicase-2/ATP-dependent DNA helicase PcrA
MSENTFKDSYNSLNLEQKQAVDQIDGPVLVVAGPGTGKTQLLSTRVANILQKTDTNPEEILCLTFTDAASYNMRQRLEKIIGKTAFKVKVHTFHNLGSEIISQNPEYFFFGLDFEPSDELGQISVLQKILQKADLNNPLQIKDPDGNWVYLKDIKSAISDLKMNGLNPENFLENLKITHSFLSHFATPLKELFAVSNIKKLKLENFLQIHSLASKICSLPEFKDALISKSFCLEVAELAESEEFFKQNIKAFRDSWCKKDDQNNYQLKDLLAKEKQLALQQIYAEYQQGLRREYLYDFNDMILEVIEVLQKFPELRFEYQEKFLYFLVDEFQDTNAAQMKLLSLLINSEINENKPNILVVGDDDQAIYKFQRATLQNILDFKTNFDDVKIITLTKNYRSGQEILDFAHNIVENAQIRLSKIENLPKKLVSQR